MTEDWLGRWDAGRTGWHEADGNAGLKAHWPALPPASRVLVPLCGKSPDLLWLARRGYHVVGVELSEVAVRGFFAESKLGFHIESHDTLNRFVANDLPIELNLGDYFDFSANLFDALYDRGALVALPADMRPRYVEHTENLLKDGATRLIVTLEYEQSVVSGPPFAVLAEEVASYWDDLDRVAVNDDIDTCPPKFRAAGLQEINEIVWLSKKPVSG